MKVSELAVKLGLNNKEIVKYLKELKLDTLKVGDVIPAGELSMIISHLDGKGFTINTSSDTATLIKKKKDIPAEEVKSIDDNPTDVEQVVASVKKVAVKVKKKVVVKKRKPVLKVAKKRVEVKSPVEKKVVKKDTNVSPGVNIGSKVSSSNNRPSKPFIEKTSDSDFSKSGSAKHKKRDHKDRRHRKTSPIEKNSGFRKPERKPKLQVDYVPDSIEIMEVVSVGELARKMNLKAKVVIQKLMQLGVMATINQQIDSETATLVASEFECEVKTVSLYDETVIEVKEDLESDLVTRPPVVTVMGHVDHGKTKLLDTIRSADVVDSEAGGITQHIGAYKVTTKSGNDITFIDTPGHAAFTMMRARGAESTDIVVLVVAADDGIMPQTIEAIDHAKEAGVPIIVAINKMDKPNINVDRVKQQLADHNLLPEDWGGTTICVPVSALNNTGIDDLLESILLQAEMLELKASFRAQGIGVVIEARLDKGKGSVATILCKNGQIKVGDKFVAGIHSGSIRAMYDENGNKLSVIKPGEAAEITGTTGLPAAGAPFNVMENDRQAKLIAAKRHELKRSESSRNVKNVTMENLLEQIKSNEMTQVKVIIKADMQGSAEALKDSLNKIENETVRLVTIHNSAGAINESDVMLAAASNAIIIGFHVRPSGKAAEIADREKVDIRRYSVIYDAINDMKMVVENAVEPEYHDVVKGNAEVREIFKVPRLGIIAGCYVTDGSISRGHNIRVIREDIEIFDGIISSLKRFKDDVKEVKKDYECGIGIENYKDIKVGDFLESYAKEEIKRKPILHRFNVVDKTIM